MSILLEATSRFQGQLHLPGSKSLSNRLLLLAALSRRPVTLHRFLESQDTAHLRAALVLLGWDVRGGPTVEIEQAGPIPDRARLFLGNAGTAFRPLTAVLATLPGEFVLEGLPRMHERPIGPLVEALRELGADIEYLGQSGYPPLRVCGPTLRGGRARLDATFSSQFITALLMAAPGAESTVEFSTIGEEVSLSYVDMTIRQLELFGIKVERPEPRVYRVRPQSYHAPRQLTVEGDAAAASYFLGGAAVAGGPVRVVGAGRASCQGELGFVEVLARMGARVSWGEDWVEVTGAPLHGVDEDLRDLPDAAMTLATVALFAEGPTTIRGVANWRVKETDRQAALAQELVKVGARVELLEDGIRVHPPERLLSAAIETYADHRMAMSFALASLGQVAQTILDPGCVDKTFPNFFREWRRLASHSD